MLSLDSVQDYMVSQGGPAAPVAVLVAVSGGADSVALLHLLKKAGYAVAAAHVNYHLRGIESQKDEDYVTQLCSALQIPLYTRKSSREELLNRSNNIQNAARQIRYEFFEEVMKQEGLELLATAHHEDDQLETLLMNFLRGSGVRGMRGMSFREGHIIRPLLAFSKQEIQNYLLKEELTWREDSSNETDNYLRNRIRHHLIPVLKQVDERNGVGWIKTAERMKQADVLLQHLSNEIGEKYYTKENEQVLFNRTAFQNIEYHKQLLNHFLHQFGFRSLSPWEYKQILTAQTGTVFTDGSMTLTIDREHAVLSQEKTESEFHPLLLHPDENIPGYSAEKLYAVDSFPESSQQCIIDLNKVEWPLIIRRWKNGDTMRPLGMKGEKKVSDILTELKVPHHRRKECVVFCSGENIIWIPGYRIAESVKTDPGTQVAVLLSNNLHHE